MKIEIFDPPMCCPTGLCGPAIDPALLKMNNAILALKKQNVIVDRYNLRSDYMLIKENKLVMDLIHKNGLKILPITLVEGKLFKLGEYPSYEELCKELNIEPLQTRKPITMKIE
jgi:hypothetical protein